MKPYKLNVYNKKVGRALAGIFANGLLPNAKLDPDEKEALELVTRLGEWSEDLIDA